MSDFLAGWRVRRRHRRCPPGALKDYYGQPLPSPKLDYREAGYVAIDLETTGLDHRVDQILSLGWVLLQGPRILLASARHRVVRVQGPIPAASAVIHQITDDQSAAGGELAAALELLLADLAGRVLIAHHAQIERGFLNTACQRVFGCGLLVRSIDTQVLAHRTLERRQIAIKPGDLRLHALCERYHLPRYAAHNALADAMAAAELFLAQAAYHGDERPLKLRDFLC